MLALLSIALTVLATPAQISHVPGPVLHGGADELFGWPAAGAGDVNADGFADVLAAGVDNGSETTVRVFSGLDGTQLFEFAGLGTSLFINGQPCAAAGDVDGDGHADILVGNAEAGTASLHSGRDGSVIFDFTGDVPGDGFGGALASAGDVNGDGHPDVVIGNTPPWKTPAAGYARIFSGADGSPLLTLHEESAGDSFGTVMCALGDVNGDGLGDLAVGARSDGIDFLNPGAPPFIPPFWMEDSSGFVTAFSGADGSILWTAHGDAKDDSLGWSLAPVGDVDGDGLGDVLTGRLSNNLDSNQARLLSGADGSTLANFTGHVTSQIFITVGGAGDVDLDGVPDLLVGNLPADGPGNNEAHIFSGADGSALFESALGGMEPVAVGGLGDANGDGMADFVVGVPQPWIGGGFEQVFASQDATALSKAYGCGGNPPGSMGVLAGTPALGQTVTLGLDDPPHTLALPAAAFLLISTQPDPHYPCGTSKAHWGLGAPGAAGELLVDVTAPNPHIFGVGAYTGAPLVLPLTVPSLQAIVGQTLYVQGAFVDATQRIGLTNAVALTIGVP